MGFLTGSYVFISTLEESKHKSRTILEWI